MAPKLLLTFALCVALCAGALAGEPAEAGKKTVKVLVLKRVVRKYGVPEKDAVRKEGAPSAPAPKKDKVVLLSEKLFSVKLAAGGVREARTGTDQVTVIRYDRGRVWFLDTREKTYRELSFDKINRRTAETLQRLRRRLPVISDVEQNERIKKLLGLSGKPPELTVERPGRDKKVAGEECELVVVRLDGKEFFRAWMSKARRKFFDRRWLTLGSCLPEKAAAKLAAVQGVLMEAVFPLPNNGRLEVTTSKVRSAEVDPAEFEDPGSRGYRRLGRPKKTSGKAEPPGKKSR